MKWSSTNSKNVRTLSAWRPCFYTQRLRQAGRITRGSTIKFYAYFSLCSTLCVCCVLDILSRRNIKRHLSRLGYHFKCYLLTLQSLLEIRFLVPSFLFPISEHESLTLTEIRPFLSCNYGETWLWCKNPEVIQCSRHASPIKGCTVYYIKLPTDILHAAGGSVLVRHFNLTSSNFPTRRIVCSFFWAILKPLRLRCWGAEKQRANPTLRRRFHKI